MNFYLKFNAIKKKTEIDPLGKMPEWLGERASLEAGRLALVDSLPV